MNNMVLRPLQLKELGGFFDDKAIKILRFQLEKSIIAQPERKDFTEEEQEENLQIANTYLENWCVQALENVVPVGAGSYPIDIIRDNTWGADIKGVSYKITKAKEVSNIESGEASLGQKFIEAGDNLDELFKKKEFKQIIEAWQKILKEKYDKVIQDKEIKKIYYFIFLKGVVGYYLCGTEVIINNLKNLCEDSENKRNSDKSVFLKNFIDKKYGSTKIYKSKKRLELRLRPKAWIDEGFCIKLPIPNYLPAINLRETDLDLYRKEIFNFNKNILQEEIINNGRGNLEVETGYSIYFNDIKIYQNESLDPKTSFCPIRKIQIEDDKNSISIFKNDESILSLKLNNNFKLKQNYIIEINEDMNEFHIHFTPFKLNFHANTFSICIGKKILF
ncbi:hypothetical protein [Fusobacterium sp.]|uniref:hypothetical protein n=1 Tax=Fusobacterium sp. TaxID=68766 RepID=UPI0025C11E68|nr:hypothetical protein [Fusobacterium sp.]